MERSLPIGVSSSGRSAGATGAGASRSGVGMVAGIFSMFLIVGKRSDGAGGEVRELGAPRP